MRALERGMEGKDVELWQAFLVSQQHPIGVDGNFGKNTFDATEAFQAENNLQVDGTVWHFTVGRAIELGFQPPEDSQPGKSGPDWPPPPDFKPIITNAQSQAVFGKYEYVAAPVPGNKEHIRIIDDWVEQNIEMVTLPQLIGVKGAPHDGRIQFHTKAAKQLVAMWQAWADANLSDRILTWAGSFEPRFVRGSTTVLSNHAFGSAFDINAEWNVRLTQPALLGEKGCVRELVEIANDHGFYWGGHFRTKPDGMHFDVAVLK
jgi:hypothetical protein